MRFADYLTGVGRTVAYYPSLVPIAGSVTATVLLCQLAYWTDKEADPDGWIFKTRDELKAETGLTRYEQEGARKQLVARGLMQEELRGLPAKLYYRLNRDAISDAWEGETPQQGSGNTPDKLVEKQPASWGKTHQQGGGKPTNIIRKHQSTTETTSESTAGEAASAAQPRPPRTVPAKKQDRTLTELGAVWYHDFGEPPTPSQERLLATYAANEPPLQVGLTERCIHYTALQGKTFQYFEATLRSCARDGTEPGERKPTSAPAGRAGPRPGSRGYASDWSDVTDADVDAWNRTNGSSTAVLDADDDLLFD